MSEATRALALAEAVKTVGAEGDAGAILTVAEQFHTFIQSDNAKASVTATPPAAAKPATVAAKPATVAAKPAAKPVVAAKKAPPAKTEEQLAEEALAAAAAEQDAAETAGESGATKEAVGAVVAALLAGGKRTEAVALLKSFSATSVSGVKAEDYDSFVAQGNELLADIGS